MSKIAARIKELGITLPESPSPLANYVPVVKTGNLIYLSGVGPADKPDGTSYTGKLGRELSIDEGYDAARLTAVNLIARLHGYLDDLDKIKQIVKVLSMVNATPEFLDPPAVTNGCSDLLVEVFGDKGRHARSAIGVATLPGAIPIEIELIAEIED